MIEFAHPWVLLLLLLVPLLLLCWAWRRRRTVRFPDFALVQMLPTGRSKLARWGGLLLRGLALTALILALAGARSPDLKSRIPTEGIAIEMVVDVSGSMDESDFYRAQANITSVQQVDNGAPLITLDNVPAGVAAGQQVKLSISSEEYVATYQGGHAYQLTGPIATFPHVAGEPVQVSISRFDAVKFVLHLFVQGGDLPDGSHLDGRPSDLIGLVVFATRPESVCPPTLSHSTLIEMMRREKPRTLPDESHTNISDALVTALLRLQQTDAKKKVLILLSDGEHNVPIKDTGAEKTPRQVAQLAGSLGIVVYTIDAAGPVQSLREGGLPEEIAHIREEGIRTLQEIAAIGQGSYFEARDTESLIQVYQQIDTLERSRIETYQYRRYRDYFPWFGLACFVCLTVVSWLELTWWRRVP